MVHDLLHAVPRTDHHIAFFTYTSSESDILSCVPISYEAARGKERIMFPYSMKDSHFGISYRGVKSNAGSEVCATPMEHICRILSLLWCGLFDLSQRK